MKPKTEEVYRCSECDEVFSDQNEAAYHCVELPPKEYKCLECGYVWLKVDAAIECFDADQDMKRLVSAASHTTAVK